MTTSNQKRLAQRTVTSPNYIMIFIYSSLHSQQVVFSFIILASSYIQAGIKNISPKHVSFLKIYNNRS